MAYVLSPQILQLITQLMANINCFAGIEIKLMCTKKRTADIDYNGWPGLQHWDPITFILMNDRPI